MASTAGLYTGARLLEILSRRRPEHRAERAAEFRSARPSYAEVRGASPFTLLDKIRANAKFEGAREVI